jgi:DNA-binding NarL/FixJ family response regulator
MSEITVVLIEDHDLTRIGLVAAINQFENIKIVGDAPNGKQGLEVLTQTAPDVAIIDIGLPDIDGIELTNRLKQSQNKTKVIILTMHDSEDAVLSAFAAGADSYSLKDVSLENLEQAIELTSKGDSWIDPAIARVVLKQAKDNQLASKTSGNIHHHESIREIEGLDTESQQIVENFPLTDRELEVLELIVSGCNNAQIAEQLFVSVGTIKTHVRNILNKLCVDDRTQAAVRALRSGLVE